MVFHYWRGCGPVLWQASGWPATLISAGFYASWAGLFYSLSLTGVGYQTGLTPWLYWFRGEAIPRRDFTPRGAYKILRHPVYLTFMGLVWFTPTMTADHAVLTGIWTVYLFVGSWLKDERLAYYLGAKYRSYQAQVSGYPGIFFGPLGRLREKSAGTKISLSAGPLLSNTEEVRPFPAEIKSAA
jgi:methanethiol S-methyltransferase